MKLNKKLIKQVIESGTPFQRLKFRDFLDGMAEFGDNCVPGAKAAFRNFEEEKYDGKGLIDYLQRDDESYDYFLEIFEDQRGST